MLIHPTIERLRSLGLLAMAEALIELQNNPEAPDLPHADWLGLLIDREATYRDNRRLTRNSTPPNSARPPWSKMSIIAAPAVSTAPFSKPSRRTDGSVNTSTW